MARIIHVSLFMYDYHHNTLPKSFEEYIPKNNLATNTIIKNQHNLLCTEKKILLNYLDIIFRTME